MPMITDNRIPRAGRETNRKNSPEPATEHSSRQRTTRKRTPGQVVKKTRFRFKMMNRDFDFSFDTPKEGSRLAVALDMIKDALKIATASGLNKINAELKSVAALEEVR